MKMTHLRSSLDPFLTSLAPSGLNFFPPISQLGYGTCSRRRYLNFWMTLFDPLRSPSRSNLLGSSSAWMLPIPYLVPMDLPGSLTRFSTGAGPNYYDWSKSDI